MLGEGGSMKFKVSGFMGFKIRATLRGASNAARNPLPLMQNNPEVRVLAEYLLRVLTTEGSMVSLQ